MQSENRQDHGADDQNDGLDQIGVNHRRQAAGNRVNAGHDHQNERRSERIPADHSLQNYCRRVQVNGNLGEDVGQDRDAGKINGARAAEAPLQKFRHGENVGAQIERNEYPT